MDPYSLATGVSLAGAAMMMVAIIYMLTYSLRAFSSRSGILSVKFVIYSLLYFFGSTIILFMGSYWLSAMARIPVNGLPYYLNIGASALMLGAILHIICGLLAAFLYLRDRYRIRRISVK